MLSINTNLSSLIAQQSLSSSTAKLNQAIERMSTGFKINHAKDNAANYSISTNMSTQIGAYDIAANNVAMGMDLVTTASDIISTMQDHATRLQALSTQARNGTYGEQSMSAINSEVAAIMAEINRLYSTAEYNNVSLFNREAYTIADHLPQAGESGFINENKALKLDSVGVTKDLVNANKSFDNFIDDPVTYTAEEIATMTKVASVNSFTQYQNYSISTVEELEKLATLVNNGVSTVNVTFVLGADLDLSQVNNWVPIGTLSKPFKGIFDGNGHSIKNLKIDNVSLEYAGLFGYCDPSYPQATIKNLALEDVNIKAKKYVGALAGYTTTHLINCYSTGEVFGDKGYIGGLVGEAADSNIFEKNYSTCNVTGRNQVGGLVGYSGRYMTSDCYATGNVVGENNVGGLIGRATYDIYNSWASGNVTGVKNVGGVAGYGTFLQQCYAEGDVVATERYAGGLIGFSNSSFVATNCHATGNVTGGNRIGGLISEGNVTYCYATGNITGGDRVGGLVSVGATNNCYATGDVKATGSYCGGLVGEATYNIENSFALGNVEGRSSVGGLVGFAASSGFEIKNCYATGNVKGTNSRVGGLAGALDYCRVVDCYAIGDVEGKNEIGGIVGFGKVVVNSYYSGNIEGVQEVGGIIGLAMFNTNVYNCYAEGDIKGQEFVGGLVGYLYEGSTSYSIIIEDSIAYGTLISENEETVGGIIGGAALSPDGISFGTINISNNKFAHAKDSIGGIYNAGNYGGTPQVVNLSELLNNVTRVPLKPTSTTLQVGINSDESCQINFDTNFEFDLNDIKKDISSEKAYAKIIDFINLLSDRSTKLGAIENRLNSAMESIEVNLENLVSSRSTIRDADMAEESSAYIRQQILQQASATLLATANQSPSIALQLI